MAARSFVSFLSSSLPRAGAGATGAGVGTYPVRRLTSRRALRLISGVDAGPPDGRAHVRRRQRRSVGDTAPPTGSSSSAVQPRDDGALTSSDGVVGRPIDFDTSATVEGKESQVGAGVVFELLNNSLTSSRLLRSGSSRDRSSAPSRGR